MNALVSIVIPTYNRAHLIGETLDSIIAQSYGNWECLIIDDHSTDGTDLLIDEYSKRDGRFQFFLKGRDVKQGAAAARNLGLRKAKGEYVQFLDSDDILASNKLEAQLTSLSSENWQTLTTCKWGVFSDIRDPINIYQDRADYRDFDDIKDYFDLIGLYGGFFPSHSFLVSRKLIDCSGYWNEELVINDDGEFFFRIILNAKKILFADDTYVLYRNSAQNGDNVSSLNSKFKALQLINSWQIIESLYCAQFGGADSVYLDKKKENVYNELQKGYRHIVRENKLFFSKQIKADTFKKKAFKVFEKIKLKIKVTFR